MNNKLSSSLKAILFSSLFVLLFLFSSIDRSSKMRSPHFDSNLIVLLILFTLHHSSSAVLVFGLASNSGTSGIPVYTYPPPSGYTCYASSECMNCGDNKDTNCPSSGKSFRQDCTSSNAGEKDESSSADESYHIPQNESYHTPTYHFEECYYTQSDLR